MKLVYIAGKLNGDASSYIKNLSRMIAWDIKVKRLGYATFCPGLDFLEGLLAGDFEYEDYFNSSQEILIRSDAVFLVPGWETSEGTKKEIEAAKKNNIPAFTDLASLDRKLSNTRCD